MTPKEIVLQRYPTARTYKWPKDDDVQIVVPRARSGFPVGLRLGYGRTPKAAWKDAASTLKPKELALPLTPKAATRPTIQLEG